MPEIIISGIFLFEQLKKQAGIITTAGASCPRNYNSLVNLRLILTLSLK
jgi:hypothetical protein